MEKLDIRHIVKALKKTVESHELEKKGEYRRWLWQSEEGNRDLGSTAYGCADAANILYTINEFYCDGETRKARIAALQALQDPETGMFCEDTHHTIHTTAHCTGALQLFDAKPLYPIKGLERYLEKDALYEMLEGNDLARELQYRARSVRDVDAWLDTLNWTDNPWTLSHLGAGAYAALANSDEITEEFQRNYFDWFWDNADPVTGFWKKGYADRAEYTSIWDKDKLAPIYCYMAGGFHYMFNHEYARMPLRYPDKVIDCCIKMYNEDAVSRSFCRSIGFIEIDWLFCINRASRQTAHRRDEVKALIEDFAVRLITYLNSLDYDTHDGFNDLHALFGTVCALAELQTALPGMIITEKPMRLVLDRRPFI